MAKSTFDLKRQQKSLSSKLVAGLERVSEVFKVLLWEKAKVVGLSPIQIQLLVFIAYHRQELCHISQLAKEFHVTKPTISDAVKVLVQKNLVEKDFSNPDNRSYSLFLTEAGRTVLDQVTDFSMPLASQLDRLKRNDLEQLFSSLSSLIFNLHQVGILNEQRMCYSCIFFQSDNQGNYCKLLERPLASSDIRLDCPEFEARLTD